MGIGSVSTDPVWAGYAQGFGGSLSASGALVLTGARVQAGLSAYAEVLGTTWVGPYSPAFPRACLHFMGVGGVGNRPSGRGIARFPRMPDPPIVPASALLAAVPQGAPQADAGAQFVMWLVGLAGQGVLGAFGFPSVRVDVPNAPYVLDRNKQR